MNSVVPITLPDSGNGTASLPGSEVGVSYVASNSDDAGPAEAHQIGSLGALYPTVDTDTDLFLAPRATGFEIYAQLRSAASPSDLRFDFDMPAGSQLESAPGQIEGAQVISAAGDTLVTITPPMAIDADGDAVKADLSLKGDSIVLHISHDESSAYPILVDPEVNDVYSWPSGAGFDGWYQSAVTDADYQQYQNIYPNTGLWSIVSANKTLSPGSSASWYYLIPHYGSTDTTYIANLYLKASFSVGATNQVRPKVAIGERAAPGNGWVRWKTFSDETALTGGWFSDPAVDAAAFQPSWNTPLQDGFGQSDATRAEFQMFTTSTGVTTNSSRVARLDSAWVQLTDSDQPSGTLSGLTGWMDGQDAGYLATSHAVDGGLGVKTQTFVMGQDSVGLNVAGTTQTSSCTGVPTNSCNQTWSQAFAVDPSQLRDGIQASAAGVVDVVGHGYINGAWWGIDRQRPKIDEVVSETSADGTTVVTVHASDGSPGGRDVNTVPDRIGAESGVKEISIDAGDGEQSVTQPCDGDGVSGNGDPTSEVPWGSCAMSASFDVPSLAPTESISVTAADQVGNVSNAAPPSVGLDGYALADGEGWLRRGEQTITVSATDDGLGDDGIDVVRLSFDGEMVAEEQGCDSPCTFDEPLTFETFDAAPGLHTISVAATDGDGNITRRAVEVNLDNTKPTIAVSGELFDLQGEELTDRFNDLSALVTEQGLAENESGIAGARVLIDGQPVDQVNEGCDPTCPPDLNVSYIYDRDSQTSGGHTVTIEAADRAGNFAETRIAAGYVEVPGAEAECPIVEPDSVASDVVTPSQAEAEFSNHLPAAVAPSEPVTTDLLGDPETYDPSLASSSTPGELPYVGTEAGGWADDDADGGQMIGDTMCLRPGDSALNASDGDLVAGGDALLFANTQDATDTLIRPAVGGSEIVGQVRSQEAPSTFNYQVGLSPTQHLEELGDGSVAVVDGMVDPESPNEPEGDPASAEDAPSEPPAGLDGVDGLHDAAQQLEVSSYYMSEAQRLVDGDVVGVITPPVGVDAEGRSVATDLDVDGAGLSIQVDHGGLQSTYPTYYKTDILGRYGASCKAHSYSPDKQRRDPAFPSSAGPRQSIFFAGKYTCHGSRPDRTTIYVELRQRKKAGPFGFWDEVEDTPIYSREGKYRIGAGNFDDCRRSDGGHKFETFTAAYSEYWFDTRRDQDQSRNIVYNCDQ